MLQHELLFDEMTNHIYSKSPDHFLKSDPEILNKYDLSSHRIAIHAAAPCPVEVKEKMIDWWGPIINEYYAGTEFNGFVACNSEQWPLF